MKIYLFQSIWAHNSHEILVSRCTILAAVSCYWCGQYYTQYQFIRAIQYLWCVDLYYEAWNINNHSVLHSGVQSRKQTSWICNKCHLINYILFILFLFFLLSQTISFLLWFSFKGVHQVLCHCFCISMATERHLTLSKTGLT